MNSIWKNNTWTLEPLPQGHRIIPCKWVFKIKPRINGQPSIKKVCLVACKFEQCHGIDFDKTFILMIKWEILHTVVALATTKRWDIHHMDKWTTFHNGLLKEKVYKRQPPGIRMWRKETMVCRLYKSLYGLKQSPYTWYDRIDATFYQLGLYRNKLDNNLYFMHQDKKILLFMLHINNLFITRSSNSLIS